MYEDYTQRLAKDGPYFRHLPTPQALYGCAPGDPSFTLSAIPFTTSGPASPLRVRLERISPLKNKKRDVIFVIAHDNQEERYTTSVKDASGGFEFEGDMASPENPKELGSPMPGAVEKLLVASGDEAKAGDTLAVISAMKMEVKVTAPCDTRVKRVSVQAGDQVVEGALLFEIE